MLWGAPAGVEMKRVFVSNLRLLAQFAREPLSADLEAAIARTSTIRQTINTNLDRVRALADGVLFEFGPTRQADLALRDRVRKWQPQLRTVFLVRIALLKYRLRLPGFELPEAVVQAQQAFDQQTAQMLDNMAGRIEGQELNVRDDLDRSFGRLEQAVRTSESPETAAHLNAFLSLCRTVRDLLVSLDSAV
jgi:multidrug resistance protein MdtO